MAEIPTWAQKEVPLASLRLRSLPINWYGIRRVSEAVNELKNEPIPISDVLEVVRPTRSLDFTIPMVASVIAHRRNSEIPIIYPTAEQVKQLRPLADAASRLIRRFSANWQARFDRFLEGKGEMKVEEATAVVMSYVDKIGEIDVPNPQEVFVEEVEDLYRDVARKEIEDGGFLGMEKVEIPAERKITEVIEGVYYVRGGGFGTRFNTERFPLLSKLVTLIPSFTVDPGNAGIAGTEVMNGIRQFLVAEGVSALHNVPKPREFNIFDMGTWARVGAEWFFSERLERIKRALPDILKLSKEAIPNNPKAIVEEVYQIAENVVILHTQGKSDREIVDALFTK